MTREEGKTLPEAIGEVTRAINIFRYFGGEGARQFSYNVPSERPQVLCYTIRKPLGTVALITPWNFPSAIPAWKARACVDCRKYSRAQACIARPAQFFPTHRSTARSGYSERSHQLHHRQRRLGRRCVNE